jgi:hypothetical protein
VLETFEALVKLGGIVSGPVPKSLLERSPESGRREIEKEFPLLASTRTGTWESRLAQALAEDGNRFLRVGRECPGVQ